MGQLSYLVNKSNKLIKKNITDKLIKMGQGKGFAKNYPQNINKIVDNWNGKKFNKCLVGCKIRKVYSETR